jgi:hypothetical protein
VIEQNSAQAEIETMIRKREIFHGMDKLDINVVGLDVKPVRMYDAIVYFTDRVVPLCVITSIMMYINMVEEYLFYIYFKGLLWNK